MKIADVLADWNGLGFQNVHVIATEQRHLHQFIVLWPIHFFELDQKAIAQRHEFCFVRLIRSSDINSVLFG